MVVLVPEYLTFDYQCHFRGTPGAKHDPEDYPVFWTVNVKAKEWENDDDDEGKEVSVGQAHLYLVPDAGIIDLFLTLDAVSQEVGNVGETLTINCPELIDDLAVGGDLLVLSSLQIAPTFRGNKLGHAILKAILCTIGRSASKVVLEAKPILSHGAPLEGTPEHELAKAALRQYWESFGFQAAYEDYLVFEDMAGVLD